MQPIRLLLFAANSENWRFFVSKVSFSTHSVIWTFSQWSPFSWNEVGEYLEWYQWNCMLLINLWMPHNRSIGDINAHGHTMLRSTQHKKKTRSRTCSGKIHQRRQHEIVEFTFIQNTFLDWWITTFSKAFPEHQTTTTTSRWCSKEGKTLTGVGDNFSSSRFHQIRAIDQQCTPSSIAGTFIRGIFGMPLASLQIMVFLIVCMWLTRFSIESMQRSWIIFFEDRDISAHFYSVIHQLGKKHIKLNLNLGLEKSWTA